MNIFATHREPEVSAYALDDKRLGKMVLESAQMMSTVLLSLGCTESFLYSPVHQNNPCTLWVGATRGNFDWIAQHALALSLERLRRGFNPHRSTYVVEACYLHRDWVPDGPRQPFVNCARRRDLDIDFTHVKPTPLAYRKYLCARWSLASPTWTNSSPPKWRT